jgi:hypothetical protein
MKKTVIVFALLFVFAAMVSAQVQNLPVTTEHFEITAVSGEGGSNAASDTELLGREMELRFDVYNKLFRFDPSLLASPLKVRAFTRVEDYDAYVAARAGDTKAGAIYLHYNQADKRELVLLRGSAEESAMLPHQAFIQFLRAFIPNPPFWMREGFAIYFNTLTFDPKGAIDGQTGALNYEENLAWLETVKKLKDSAPPARDLLNTAEFGTTVPTGSSQTFQICSWALVSFFLNNGKEEYFRSLIESFMLLSPTASAADNTNAVMRRFSVWTDFDALQTDFQNYISARKTFAELMEDGRMAYAAKDPVAAELSFLGALDQKPSHYAPYYYLGLLAFDEKSYDMAEQYYYSSIRNGADEALVTYALGINAAAAGRNSDAVDHLQKAAALSPARYKIKADALIPRLK